MKRTKKEKSALATDAARRTAKLESTEARRVRGGLPPDCEHEVYCGHNHNEYFAA